MRGLRRDDPGDWPIAFDAADFAEDGRYAVAFLSSHADILTEAEFRQLLERFRSAYEAEYGHAPEILWPDVTP